MKNGLFLFLLLIGTSVSAQSTRIAFGSCAKQYHPLAIFDTIVERDPTHFIFLGDNIYADTDDPTIMKAKYDTLAMKPGFQKLMGTTTVWATWDDHDYGRNDAGKEYEMKKESKDIFLDFFKEPANSERRKHKGIYTSYQIQDSGLVIQVILLDTRTFRSSLKANEGQYVKDSVFTYDIDYAPNPSKKTTILGKKQWKWLKKELSKPADVRIIGSSIQFGHSFNGFESWNNFPLEKQRMLETIEETKANGVLFITGDVHFGEISVLEDGAPYPIFDATSSGLSSKLHFSTPNTNRIQGPVMPNNFGMISFEKTATDCQITIQLIDANNVISSDVVLPLSLLKIQSED